MTTGPFTGVRFYVIEESDLGDTIVEEHDSDYGLIDQMRAYLQQHVDELNRDNPCKHYYLKQDNNDLPDESQQIQP